MKIYSIFLLKFFLLSPLICEDTLESTLNIQPPINYHQNQKYEEVLEYKENSEEEKENALDFGVDLDVNKELMTIDRLKIDLGTKFKGID